MFGTDAPFFALPRAFPGLDIPRRRAKSPFFFLFYRMFFLFLRNDPRASFFCFWPSFTGFYLVLPGFTGFYWVLLGFTGFYLVLLGFTGFYWVLPSFTGFNWVLLGFT